MQDNSTITNSNVSHENREIWKHPLVYNASTLHPSHNLIISKFEV